MNVYAKSKLIWDLLQKAIRLLNACRIFAEKSDENTPGRRKILTMIEEFDEELLNANKPDEH